MKWNYHIESWKRASLSPMMYQYLLAHPYWSALAEYVTHDLAKIFFTSKFQLFYFSATPHIKLRPRICANRCKTINSKPPCPMTNTETHSQIIFITLLFRHVPSFAGDFTNLGKLRKYATSKPFSCAKPACFDFSSSNFNLHSHIRSTGEDALRPATACGPNPHHYLCMIIKCQ